MRKGIKRTVCAVLAGLIVGGSTPVYAVNMTGAFMDLDDGDYREYSVDIEMKIGESISGYDILQKMVNEYGFTIEELRGSNMYLNFPYSPYIVAYDNNNAYMAVETGTVSTSINTDQFVVNVNITVIPVTTPYSGGGSSGSTIITPPEEEDTTTESITVVEDDSEQTTEGILSEDTTDVAEEPVTEETQATTRVVEQVTETTTQAIAADAYFDDIAHRQWAVNAINLMASKGYLSGIGNRLFNPDAYCKRCDFVIADIKMSELQAIMLTDLQFTDVFGSDYFSDYLQIAVDNNVISNAGIFRPFDFITREEAAVVIYNTLRAQEKLNVKETDIDAYLNYKYSDAAQINPSYKAAISALTEMGIMSGTSITNKTFEPKAKITRAQMAVLLNNVSQY